MLVRIQGAASGAYRDIHRLPQRRRRAKRQASWDNLFFPRPLDQNESEAFFEKIQHRYNTDGYCFWAVIRKSDNIFLGICGLLSQTIDGQKETEVGYRISNEYWGQGYGTEAAGGCIQYAKEMLKLDSTISLIRPANFPCLDENAVNPQLC